LIPKYTQFIELKSQLLDIYHKNHISSVASQDLTEYNIVVGYTRVMRGFPEVFSAGFY